MEILTELLSVGIAGMKGGLAEESSKRAPVF